jgi:hypothetical protein
MRPVIVSPAITRLLAITLAAVSDATAAGAQPRLSGGLDVAYAPGYVWRGVTRSERMVLTPAAFVRVDRGPNTVSAGAWSAWEVREAPAQALTLRPPRSPGFAELDLWAQYTRHVARSDVSLGVVRYVFPGDGGEDATEAYLQLWPDSTGLPVDLRGAAYLQLEGDHAAYAQVEASRSFSLIPLPSGPPSVVLGATAGFSLRAPDDARLARFSDQGPTHLLLSADLMVPAERITLRGGLRHQRGFDDATRALSPVRERGHRTWGELGVSYALGFRGKAK